MTRKQKLWVTELYSHELCNPYSIFAKMDNKVFWEWYEPDSVAKATQIYELIEDFKRALKASGYVLNKEITVGDKQ